MKAYYSDKLSAERLKRCYEIAPERVKKHLEAEIDFVLDKIKANFYVLELGSGYGRIVKEISKKSKYVFGIDLSLDSLLYSKEKNRSRTGYYSVRMNAGKLAFATDIFDVVLCLQNGISAFKIDPAVLVTEALQVTKSGGFLFFSSYSAKFWEPRLEWFQIQSKKGLIGEIDYNKTGNGVIICKDGFKATTFGPFDFKQLIEKLGVRAEIVEVDCSIIFCIIKVA